MSFAKYCFYWGSAGGTLQSIHPIMVMVISGHLSGRGCAFPERLGGCICQAMGLLPLSPLQLGPEDAE
jgi:hypothetical protein